MNKQIIDPRVNREFGSCFYLAIPICDDDTEFKELMHDAYKVERAVKSMLDGSISVEDLLEAVEPFIPCMDDYVEEIEQNMNEALIRVYQ
jgi:hypothetical protein